MLSVQESHPKKKLLPLEDAIAPILSSLDPQTFPLHILQNNLALLFPVPSAPKAIKFHPSIGSQFEKANKIGLHLTSPKSLVKEPFVILAFRTPVTRYALIFTNFVDASPDTYKMFI